MIDASQEVLSVVPRQNRRRAAVAAAPASKSSASGKKSLNLKRVFSDANTSPFDQVEWERRTAAAGDEGSGIKIFLR